MKEEKEYLCPECGSVMDKLGPPNEGWLQCPNDRWIEKIENYDSWVEWYRAYHDNPDCKHDELVFHFVHDHNAYKENDSYKITFGCSCKKCFHHVNVKVSKANLSQFLTKIRAVIKHD